MKGKGVRGVEETKPLNTRVFGRKPVSHSNSREAARHCAVIDCSAADMQM